MARHSQMAYLETGPAGTYPATAEELMYESLDNFVHHSVDRLDHRIWRLPRSRRPDSPPVTFCSRLADFALCNGTAGGLKQVMQLQGACMRVRGRSVDGIAGP